MGEDIMGYLAPERKAGFAQAMRVHSLHPAFNDGLSAGTEILTADGALPVEFLNPGDRIITRSGMRVLRNIDTIAPKKFTLTFDTPEVIYADGLMVRSDTGLPHTGLNTPAQ